MARFYVGQRVKKVRGRAVGLTGKVVGPFCLCPEVDVCIRIDQPWVGEFGKPFVAGEVAFCDSTQWEPIIDSKHEACDEDFKRDLDALLERQGVAA